MFILASHGMQGHAGNHRPQQQGMMGGVGKNKPPRYSNQMQATQQMMSSSILHSQGTQVW